MLPTNSTRSQLIHNLRSLGFGGGAQLRSWICCTSVFVCLLLLFVCEHTALTEICYSKISQHNRLIRLLQTDWRCVKSGHLITVNPLPSTARKQNIELLVRTVCVCVWGGALFCWEERLSNGSPEVNSSFRHCSFGVVDIWGTRW